MIDHFQRMMNFVQIPEAVGARTAEVNARSWKYDKINKEKPLDGISAMSISIKKAVKRFV